MQLATLLVIATVSVLAAGQGIPPIQVPTPIQTPQVPPKLPDFDPAHKSGGVDAAHVPYVQSPPTASAAKAPAAKVLYMEAARATAIVPIDSTIARWRSNAAEDINCVRINGYQIWLDAVSVVLSYDPGDPVTSNLQAGTDAEDRFREAQDCTRRYLEDLKKIEYYSGAKDEADRRYQQRLQNLRIDRTGSYAINVSHTTAHYSTSQSSDTPASQTAQKQCHDEPDYRIQKVPTQVGFRNGEPYYEMREDVVRYQKRICD